MRNERGSTMLLALVWMIISAAAVGALVQEVGFGRLNVIYGKEMLQAANLAEAGLFNGYVSQQAANWPAGNHQYTVTTPEGQAIAFVFQVGVSGDPTSTVTIVSTATVQGKGYYHAAAVKVVYTSSVDCSQGSHSAPDPCATGTWNNPPPGVEFYHRTSRTTNPLHMTGWWR